MANPTAADSIVWNVVQESGQFDYIVQEAMRSWPEHTSQELTAFWAQSEWADLAPYGPSSGDWNSIGRTLERLLERSAADVPARRWQELADAADSLSAADPLARCIVALHAVAGYQGSTDRSTYGWHVIVPSLGRALLDADALYGAEALISTSLRRLQGSIDLDEPHPAAGDYIQVLGEVQRRFAAAYAQLAWALWTCCANSTGVLRAEVTALFWTSGDVPHSVMMREDSYIPPFPIIRRLVERTVRRIPDDPLIQFVWLLIKECDSFPIRDHTRLFPRINLVYRTKATAQLEALPFPQLDAAFASTVVHFFRGSLTEELIDSYDLAIAAYSGFPLEVWFQTRVVGLGLLLSGEKTGWERLAEAAGRSAHIAAAAGELDDYDLALDIPFYYVNADDPALLSNRIDRIELYRCYAQWQWMRMRRPGPPNVPHAASHLVRREQEILRSTREALQKALVGRSPGGEQFGSAHYVSGGPFNQELVARQLEESDEQLERVWTDLEPYAPSYVRIRRNPVVTVDVLADVLMQHQQRSLQFGLFENLDELIELARAAATDLAAAAELEKRLEGTRVFALGRTSGPSGQSVIVSFPDPDGHSSQAKVILMFTREAALRELQDEIPELRDLEVVLVDPRGVRRISPPSTRVVLDFGDGIDYELKP